MNTMDILENLRFQKEKFPEIYNSYKNNSSIEVASTLLQLDDYERNNNIFILTENFEDILLKAFNIPKYMLINYDLGNYNLIYLYKDFEEKLDVRDDILEIYYPYVYNLQIDKVIISNKIKRDSMNNIDTLFMLKEISLFEKSYLKKCQYKVKRINEISDLKDIFISFKPSYNESELVNKINKSNLFKTKNIDTYLDEHYKISVSMDFIRSINKDNNKQIFEIINELITKSMRIYEKESKNILKEYINNNFISNYKLIDSYLNNKNNLQKFLNENFKKELRKRLKETNNKSTDKVKGSDIFKSRNLVNLLNSDISKIDEYLSYSLSSLIKSINDI
ncbi:hypothetical protein [Clostridium tarantellae]|uniref:Uncharacterized protein n=1 Tax=Clostridium tarantellae TaxID=39493 RepID=A0A6I1MLM5_9CLOT|nr:hypothetical protein [Clostridium tarantellae]MPQ44315.1 hypothetical protein [Clostridium tarantellae]